MHFTSYSPASRGQGLLSHVTKGLPRTCSEPDRPSPKRATAAAVRSDRLARLRRVERWARFLDTAIRIPGLGIRLGADSLLGLVPGVGDLGTIVFSTILVREAYKAGVSYGTLWRMAGNIGVDAIIGIIPIAGDVFDVFFRANMRNARLLANALRELERNEQ